MLSLYKYHVIRIIVVSSVLLMSLHAFAGNKVGNGGNVIVCKTTEVLGVKAVLLDFYENDLKTEKTEKTYEQIAEDVFNKLKTINPRLANQYLKRIKEVVNELDFKSKAEFSVIPDSLHLFKPPAKDCEVVQTAIRRALTSSQEKRFLIRKDIWEQLDATQKAGLITHEIIYEHFVVLGEEDSTKARKVNAYLHSKNINAESFWKMMRELEISIYP